MHGPDAMRSLFPPAAIDTGIEMGHQSIQHIKHALRKHRALALLALTHLILQFSQLSYIVRHGSGFSSFPVKFFDFLSGKKNRPAFQAWVFRADLNMWDTFLRYYTAGGANTLRT